MAHRHRRGYVSHLGMDTGLRRYDSAWEGMRSLKGYISWNRPPCPSLSPQQRSQTPMFAHFLAAQDPVYPTVLAELRAGDKRTHWMWFIFPQLTALGRSATAKRYGLADGEAAGAYLAHPVLGARLRECVQIVLGVEGRTASAIFHSPDDLKFRSCLTLFEAVAAPADAAIFTAALAKFYRGEPDQLTLDLLAGDV